MRDPSQFIFLNIPKLLLYKGAHHGGKGDETLRYYYDNTGEVLSIGYIKGSKAENKYFFTRNAQNDIVSVYRSSDSKLIGTYEYDLWGKPISIKEATPGIDTDGILTKNPLRYRGYRYDAETVLFVLRIVMEGM